MGEAMLLSKGTNKTKYFLSQTNFFQVGLFFNQQTNLLIKDFICTFKGLVDIDRQ
jgi:hypothetical protein